MKTTIRISALLATLLVLAFAVAVAVEKTPPVVKLPPEGEAVGDCVVTAQGEKSSWNGKTETWCEEKAQQMGGTYEWECKFRC